MQGAGGRRDPSRPRRTLLDRPVNQKIAPPRKLASLQHTNYKYSHFQIESSLVVIDASYVDDSNSLIFIITAKGVGKRAVVEVMWVNYCLDHSY